MLDYVSEFYHFKIIMFEQHLYLYRTEILLEK